MADSVLSIMKLKREYFGGVCLLGLIVVLSGCVTEPSALTGQNRSYGYTWQQELELGRKSDRDLIREMGLYPDDALASYVTAVGERVLEQSSLRMVDTPEIYRNLEFKFRVMDTPVVNAFALPGGYVYVTRGLLAHLRNEAQLAVVLGHEITHVAARHASQQALKQQWGQIGLVAGAVIGQGITGNEQFADQFLGLGGSVFQMLTRKYGRDANANRIAMAWNMRRRRVMRLASRRYSSILWVGSRTSRVSVCPPGNRVTRIPENGKFGFVKWRSK